MHYRSVLIICTLLAMPAACFAHMGGWRKLEDSEPTVYCGRNLARVLAGLCYGNSSPVKRGDIGSGTMYEMILSPYYKDQELSWPWISHSKANELGMPNGRRDKRVIGIISECCDKACSIDELLTYC